MGETTMTTTPDLDDILMGDEPDWDDDEKRPEPHTLDDLQVDRYLRRYFAIQDQVAKVEELAAQREAEIHEWRMHEMTRLENRLDWLAQILDGWGRTHRTPRDKTFSFPSGKIATKEDGGRFKVTDAKAFVDWAKKENRTDLIRATVVEAPEVASIQAWLKPGYEHRQTAVQGSPQRAEPVAMPDTGEVVPGVLYDPPFVRVTVKP